MCVQTREEMKKLAALKPVVGAYAQEEEAFKATESTRQQILDRLRACDDQMNGIKSEEEKQRAHVSELRSREAGTSQDLPTLAKERDELRQAASPAHPSLAAQHLCGSPARIVPLAAVDSLSSLLGRCCRPLAALHQRGGSLAAGR